jgi:hypothetical protein
MLDFNLRFAPIAETGGGSIETGELAENPGDESIIIGDQDETSSGSPQRLDQVMGGMGSDDVGLDNDSFATGEADVVEQMSRTTRQMDHATGRVDDPFEGYDPATPRDEADL